MSEYITLTCCPGCDREAALKADIVRLRDDNLVLRCQIDALDLLAKQSDAARTLLVAALEEIAQTDDWGRNKQQMRAREIARKALASEDGK